MNIGSHQSLLNLIGSDNVPGIDRLKDCISTLGKICNCQKQRKNQKQEECNVLYINFVTANTNNLVEYFKSKTQDNEIIFSYGSNHIIKTLKLR